MNAHERLTREALIASFFAQVAPYDRWLVGAEFERHLLRPDGHPVSYSDPNGVMWLLESLARDGGWTPKLEGQYPIALERDGEWVTLEPGGQFELSGRPAKTVGEVVDEARAFATEVDGHLAGTGVQQVALGYTPFTPIGDVQWVPKGRYVVMREHLAVTGKLAHHMMKGTAAVQVSFDYSSEDDCADKVRVASLLGPLTTAMFANSPIVEGRPTDWASFRGRIWMETDPRRTGFPDAAEGFTFERWTDYLLDVPMMFTHAGGVWRPAGGVTFRHWMDHGLNGVYPGWDDWELHMTSVFPEVRVKRTIEVRGADCVSLDLAAGLFALFKGLFYCKRALDQGTELALRFASCGTAHDRFEVACRDGLTGVVGGRRLSDWAEELVALTDSGLSRCGPEERVWLEPLAAQIATGESPAHALLREWKRDPTPARLMALSTYH